MHTDFSDVYNFVLLLSGDLVGPHAAIGRLRHRQAHASQRGGGGAAQRKSPSFGLNSRLLCLPVEPNGIAVVGVLLIVVLFLPKLIKYD